MSQQIVEPSRTIPVAIEADVVVAGGGPGGLCAAVAAARNGAKTALIERYGFLGGMATAGLVNPFMPFHLNGEPLTGGIFEEWIDGMRRRGGYVDKGRLSSNVIDAEAAKASAMELVLGAGVQLMVHAFVDNVLLDDGGSRIRYLCLAAKKRIAAAAPVFIDATGDADVAYLAGVPCDVGRDEDHAVQPMTLCFRMRGVDRSKMPAPGDRDARAALNRLYERAKQRGAIRCPRENVLYFQCVRDDEIHFNQTRVVGRNATDPFDLTAAEIDARQQVEMFVAWLRAEVPAFKDAYLSETAPQIGVRETRRIRGLYTLTGDDVLSARKFPDGIARTNYPIDIHSPTGEGTVIKHVPAGDWYEIPYRCLVPQKIDNLLVASRSISANHAAHSSLRVMPPVGGIGEAAGTAAAMCLKTGCKPADLPVQRLVDKLIQQGQPLVKRQAVKA
jgi:hypothetical protein